MIAERPTSESDSRLTVWRSVADRMPAGGDWCDILPLEPGVVGLTIGDVAGHGAPASTAMEIMRTAIRDAMAATRVPSAILGRANDAACRFGDGIIVTAIVAFIDECDLTLTFANAGHPPPLMLTGTGHAFVQGGVADIPLGIFPAYRAGDCVVSLPLDALLVFYTDGITDHERDPIRGESELVDAARSVYAKPALNAARAIARRVFKDARGTDDAAAMCLRTAATRRVPLRAQPDASGRSRLGG